MPQSTAAHAEPTVRMLEKRAGAPLRVVDPFVLDELVERAAGVLQRCAPTPRVYAEAMGISEGRARALFRGENAGPAMRALELGERLDAHEECSIIPLINELQAIHKRRVRRMPTLALVRRWHQLTNEEDAAEADENRATRAVAYSTCPDQLTGLLQADSRETDIQSERKEISYELKQRGVNPCSNEWLREVAA